MLAKNQINRNKMDNRAKSNNKNLDSMLIIPTSMDILNGSKITLNWVILPEK